MELIEPHITLNDQTMRQAFRTKALLNESKKSNLIKLDAQYKTQLHQGYPLYTWIIDVVFFGKENNTYLLCVEANTRYAVINQSYRDGKRVARQLTDLRSKNKVRKIIGDGDKAFTANVVKEFCDDNDIEYDFRKAKDTNHTHTAILDRIVRTFRDMLFNLKVKEPNPLDMKTIADIYNKTKHETLSKVLDQPITPEGLHRNESLQLLLIRRLRGINWSKTHVKSYVIPEGRKVFVRARYGKMEKRRGTVENDEYHVVSHEGALYRVKNKQGDEKVVPRRDLRVSNIID